MLLYRWWKSRNVKDSLQGGNRITHVGCSSHMTWYCLCSIITFSIPWKSRRNTLESSKRVMRYLKGTKNYKLTLRINHNSLLGYADVDWASQDHRHSISVYIFQINGGSISWSCQKQNIVTLSSTEAEFIVLTHAMKEALCLQHFITEVIQPLKSPIRLYSDDQSAITITYGNQQHARTKYFDKWHYFLHDTIENSQIMIEYLPTKKMLADILTKGLPGPKVKSLVDKLGRY